MQTIARTLIPVNRSGERANCEARSSRLAAANARLADLRLQHSAADSSHARQAGSFSAENAQRQLNQRRQIEAHQTTNSRVGGWLQNLAGRLTTPQPSSSQSANTAASSVKTIKLYPSLALAWLKQQKAAEARIWLLCQHLDNNRRGWLEIQTVRTHLASKTSPLHVCGWRQLRRLLQRGEGIFWERDAFNRLWLRGTARVTHALGVEKLRGTPVKIAVKNLCQIKLARAHFYAGFFALRQSDAPIARATLAELTGVNERQQPTYEKLAGIDTERCIAIGDRFSAENLQQQTWLRTVRGGSKPFIFTDHQGKQGKRGARYIAWHLPNRYIAHHQSTTKGRQRKLNRQLQTQQNLVTTRARGNLCDSAIGMQAPEKLFFDDGKRAVTKHELNAQDFYLRGTQWKANNVWQAIQR